MLSLSVGIAVLLLAAAVIAYPLLYHRREEYRLQEAVTEEFSPQDALLEALTELEHSLHQGKLTEQDYQQQKARLQREYVVLLESQARSGGAPGA